MKRLACIALLSTILTAQTGAQSAPTSAEIYLGLRKLNVLGSVLYVAAHPDDENTRLLTWLSKEGLYKTGYLSLTRGDGGQNLIGNEQGIELGLIRTQELLAARRIDGAEQYFTRAYDFGFSKTPSETFTKWDKDKILADVVWVIRKTRPDVIITRFPTTGEGGHGHHTASAILAGEAFSAAADPKRFPEQLKWVQPWAAWRIVWNTFNFGGNNTQRENQLKIDVGAYNPVLGKSYGEIAADSRSQHKSQGFGVPRTRGEALEYFQPTAGEAPAGNLFSGVNTSWAKVRGGAKIQVTIENIISSFDFLRPQQSVPRLVALHKDMSALPAGLWKEIKMKEVQSLIEQASGLFMDAFTSLPFVAQTDSAYFNFSLNSRLGNNIVVKRISIGGRDTILNTTLVSNRNLGFSKPFFVPATYPLTQPYWLQKAMSEGYFNVLNPTDIGKPDVDPAFTAQFHLDIEGQAFVFTKPVRYKFTDPVKGELYQPFVVLPRVSVNTAPSVVIVKKQAPVIFVTAKANKALTGENRVAAINLGGKPLEKVLEGRGLQKGAGTEIELQIPPASLKLPSTNAVPLIRHGADNGSDSLALSTIRYDHIPNINYFYADGAKVLNIDLKTKGKKLGYIVGAGDKVPEALEAMGYEVTLIGEKEMARLSLQLFDAVISGVRAYNTADWLNTYHEKLMKYVADGGNLIVQYNTSNNNGPVRAKIGPLPFTISRNRVTDEGAAVAFLAPQHPALNYPNRITQDDFKGWIQERSIYGATEMAPEFQTILGMNDPGERSDSGSLIIAPHGKGYFTYTGLVFFRELPAGVPGAYRLLANLIALNQKREM